MSMTPEHRQSVIEQIRGIQSVIDSKNKSKISTYYPDNGPLRRELYPKHMEFFAAGAVHRERAAMAGNRVGKTEGLGAYECTLHLTGNYPEWWSGRRFEHPVNIIAAGDTRTTTRDIQQAKLCGPLEALGTGMIPAASIIGEPTRQQGVTGAYDIVHVKHELTGGASVLQFRSYDQGRKAFQGTERDVVWLDEEPPKDVYDECLIRTMTTNGIILATFTPLNGLSEVAMSFLPELSAGLQ